MTNAPKDFDLAQELAETADWDEPQTAGDDPDRSNRARAGRRRGRRRTTDADETTGARDLAERYALRRVAGLSTELEDISEVEYRQLRLERVILVGVWTDGSVQDAENSMAELALLAETAGSEVLDALYQRRDSPDPATYIGRGKVEGLAEIVRATGADTVILDGELAPSQLQEPRGQGQGQGRRPHRADPRHLRPAREEQGGPGAGRAGPAQLHEAAAPRLGWQPVPPGRWPRRRPGWRHRWPWSR